MVDILQGLLAHIPQSQMHKSCYYLLASFRCVLGQDAKLENFLLFGGIVVRADTYTFSVVVLILHFNFFFFCIVVILSVCFWI